VYKDNQKDQESPQIVEKIQSIVGTHDYSLEASSTLIERSFLCYSTIGIVVVIAFSA
jgi:hypothetical protein